MAEAQGVTSVNNNDSGDLDHLVQISAVESDFRKSNKSRIPKSF